MRNSATKASGTDFTVHLADRDLVKSIGLKAWEAMSEEQRRAKTVAWEKRYWQELKKTGSNG